MWFSPLPQTHIKEGIPWRTSCWLDSQSCFVPRPISLGCVLSRSLSESWRGLTEKQVSLITSHILAIYLVDSSVSLMLFPPSGCYWTGATIFCPGKGTFTSTDQAGGERKHTQEAFPWHVSCHCIYPYSTLNHMPLTLRPTHLLAPQGKFSHL